MLEKRLAARGPQLFTVDGTANGIITVDDAHEWKVKQEVYLTASTLPNLDNIEIKEVIDAGHGVTPTQIRVGPKSGNIKSFVNVSAYTVALGAAISANEQKRPEVPFEEHTRAVYEEEPTVAIRSFLVDEMGNDYTTENPFPVQLSDGSINIGSVNAELEVQLSHKDDDPDVGDVHDSVRIGDGTDVLEINPDGSINVNASGASVNTPLIQNVTAVLANTEYSALLPINTRRFIIKSRSGNPKIQFSYTLGDTNTLYLTLHPGVSYSESDIKFLVPTNLYFRSNKPNEIIEIISWT